MNPRRIWRQSRGLWAALAIVSLLATAVAAAFEVYAIVGTGALLALACMFPLRFANRPEQVGATGVTPRRDPDAHLGPRARAANREERVDLSRWIGIAYSLLAVGYVVIAARNPDVVGVVLAVAWVLLAGAWVWRYRRMKRAAKLARVSDGGVT